MTVMTGSDVVVVRPLVAKLLSRYWISALCMGLPPVITLYVFTAAAGTWGYVLLIHAVSTAIGIVLTQCLRRSKIVLSADGIRETDLFTPPMSTERSVMRSILIVPVTDGNSIAVHDHLFLIDEAGRTRLRMRGLFWGDEALAAVVRAFDLPVVRVGGIKTMADLRADYPGLIYWRERHPYLLALFMAVGIVAFIGPTLWMVQTII